MTIYGPEALPPRLRSKICVNSDTGCWEWTASRKPEGYGQCTVRRKLRYAHRYVYETLVGPIPEGYQLDHLCRIRHCVNPEHLEPVTPQVNTLRGESLLAEQARRTHCPQGHEYTPENTYTSSTNHRQCRTCVRVKVAEYQRSGYYTTEAKAARKARRAA